MNIRKATNQEYSRYVDSKSPKSPLWRDMLLAFLIGGAICTLGQVLLNWYRSMGLDKENAGAAVSMSLIFLSGLFTSLSWYDDIAKYAGAGTLVPITGFANSIVAPAIEFKAEGNITGTCVKLFTIAGPVLVWGFSTATVYGLILWILSLF